MAKQTGMGAAFWVGGVDIGGDIQSVNISSPIATLDVTDITQSAVARLFGERDGAISVVSYHDPAANQAHSVYSALPTTDALATFCVPTLAQGSPAVSQVSKQINYDPTRGTDGSLTFAVDSQANAFGQEWGKLLTAGKRTDSAATVGTFYDNGAAFNFGAQAYFHLFAFSGTSVTIDIQSATTSGGSYTTTGLTTTALTAAPTAVRLSVSNVTTINEFLKVVTTGTFSNAVFAVMINVNNIAGVVF